MKKALKQYISHWAFLPMNKFSDDDSLKSKRIDFGECSKMAMIVDAIYPKKISSLGDFDVEKLDSVNDFVKFFSKKGLTEINEPPEGHK